MSVFQTRRLNPENSLICACLLSIVLACLQTFTAAVSALVFGVALLISSGQPFRGTVRRLATVNIFILLIWLFTPWSTPGQTIWHWGLLNITREGVRLSLLVTIKSNAIICVLLALVAPMSISTIGNSLQNLKAPDKLVWLLLLTFQNIHVFGEQWSKLRDAAALRGFRPKTSMHTYKTIASLLAILFIRACARAETIREAMLLRCFNGRLPCLESSGFGWADMLLDLSVMIFISILVAMELGLAHV